MPRILIQSEPYVRTRSFGLACKLCSRVNKAGEILREVLIDDRSFSVHEKCYRWAAHQKGAT